VARVVEAMVAGAGVAEREVEMAAAGLEAVVTEAGVGVGPPVQRLQ